MRANKGYGNMILANMIKGFVENNIGFQYRIIGNAEVEVDGLNLCNRESKRKSIISYVTSDGYVDNLNKAKHIKVLVVKEKDVDAYLDIITGVEGALVCVEQPEMFFYELHKYLYACTDFYNKYTFATKIGENCNISESAVIEDGVIIGNNVTIGHNSTIKHGTVIEDNVTIGCNTVIGSEGFQAIMTEKGAMSIVHVGGCHICSGTRIGDGNTVCNSLFEGETFVGKNVMTDNLVHIAHNSYIEDNVVLTAGVILCGTVKICNNAWIAPNTSILNKVTIGKYAKTGLGSVVIRDVEANSLVYGSPAKEGKK